MAWNALKWNNHKKYIYKKNNNNIVHAQLFEIIKKINFNFNASFKIMDLGIISLNDWF
jgi:hypothetical protein